MVAGFTMVEVIIVVVLLGILAAVLMPKAVNPDAITLKAQARNFASDLQRAQLLAITTGVPVTVQAIGNRYTVQYTLGTTPVTAVDVTLDSHASFSTGGTLVFNSLGQPAAASTSQSFQLSNTAAISPAVAVLSTSGRITGP